MFRFAGIRQRGGAAVKGGLAALWELTILGRKSGKSKLGIDLEIPWANFT